MICAGSWSFLALSRCAIGLFGLLCMLAYVSPTSAQDRQGRMVGLYAPDLSILSMPLSIVPPSELPSSRWGEALIMDEVKGNELLAKGEAQIFPEDGSAIPSSWWATEAEARLAKRGLWAQDCCSLLDASGDVGLIKTDAWRVVSGVPLSVTRNKSGVFVNFGPDWKTDFTLKLSGKEAKALVPENWVGERITVRGWVQWMFGPMIEVTTAQQVQVTP